MDVFRDIVQNLWRYFSMIKVVDIIDILLVTLVVYKLIGLLRKTNAMKIMRGILLILAITWAAELLELHIINFILQNTLQIGLLALVVMFQPELRKMLEQMGTGRIRELLTRDEPGGWENVILQTVEACSALSWAREGALIVFQRHVLLDDIAKTGTILNADVSAELLKNIFYPKAPLHDGAVIVTQGRVTAAGCMLPLTTSQNVSRELGMRHRAGLGMSENSDAVVIIVSEETGSVSVAESGMLKRHLDPETLEKLLRSRLAPEDGDAPRNPLKRVLGLFGRKDDE